MSISNKSEYGLRALIYLAGKREGVVPVREIAEAWSVPVKYLEQILKALKDGGFVESQVGLGGGYRLARAASEIVVGDVVRSLDGRLSPMGCASDFAYDACDFEASCGLNSLWQRTRDAMRSVLDCTTIGDLCRPAPPEKLLDISRRRA